MQARCESISFQALECFEVCVEKMCGNLAAFSGCVRTTQLRLRGGYSVYLRLLRFGMVLLRFAAYEFFFRVLWFIGGAFIRIQPEGECMRACVHKKNVCIRACVHSRVNPGMIV